GGPAVPTGRPGRASDKKPRHAGWLAIGQLMPSIRSPTSVGGPARQRPFKRAWRGFLSLRDPAGAAHAAGPPDSFPRGAAGSLRTNPGADAPGSPGSLPAGGVWVFGLYVRAQSAGLLVGQGVPKIVRRQRGFRFLPRL